MDNQFLQQIIATFIGALAAFIFSLLLFYYTEQWKNKRDKKDLSKNIQKEFDYNIAFLKKYKEDFEKIIRQITTGDKTVYLYTRMSKLQRLFIMEAFNKGLLYDYLSIEDLNDLDDLMNHASLGIDQWVMTNLNNYTSGQIDPPMALRSFEFEKSNIEKYVSILERLKAKLQNLS